VLSVVRGKGCKSLQNLIDVKVLNFEFQSLGFIWDLVSGAWDFRDFS
jgi:hypothetical protein